MIARIEKMKREKIIYWVATGLLSAMVGMSGITYFAMNDMVTETFSKLGFPTYIVYPLAIAKLLGITAILTKKSDFLKEWAYAGFFFNFLLAFSAHINAGDGEFAGALVAMVLLFLSYTYDRKLFPKS